jgi:arylsulfatase A-like enzyme
MHRPRFARALGPASLVALGACGAGQDEAAPVPAAAPASTSNGGWPVTVEPGGGEERHQYDRVVLVTIDTLRADHVSCYGYPRATTPFLDSLAARGARFTRAIAAYNCTAPSHATMLTGLVPAVHGVLQNGARLDPAALDLAEVFGAAGYESAAFLNVGFLSAVAGSFGRVKARDVGKGHVPTGAEVVDDALAWLEGERTNARFFLWVHLYDPHEWQRAVRAHGDDPAPIWSGATPEGFLAHVAELHGLPAPEPGKPYGVSWSDSKQAREGTGFWKPERFPSCVDAYDELVRFADRQLERLHARIEGLGLPGRALWIVTADHGEGLASHGVPGHGPRIYQEQLHVPLVVAASDGSIQPRVVDELVAHVDLFPTLVATLGLAVNGHPGLYEGRSLWPLLGEGAAAWPARPVLSQRCPQDDSPAADEPELFALQDGRHKLILELPGGAGAGRGELYDLAADPRELADLGLESRAAAGLRAALEERLRTYRALAPATQQGEVSEEVLRELRELGYAR